MKNRILTLAIAASFAAALMNCSGKKEEKQEQQQEAVATDTVAVGAQYAVDENFQKQLAGFFFSYVKMKDAFVATNATTVKTEAAATSLALANVDMKLLSGAAHNDWMNYLGTMESSLKEIQATDDIEAQRKSFSNLSDAFYKSIKAFGLGGATAFYEFCPMAFNDEGAYWLSDNNAIRNPYFGDKMLTCGSVKEELH